MKHLDEYRDRDAAERLIEAIARTVTRPWTIMEVCGGQTHAIMRHGLDQLLPGGVELLHGPGCPVCVTPVDIIDQALELAARPGVIFCTFGDMLRVPGSSSDLLRTKANGGDVRMVYSPLDALRLARENPDREVVFFAIGFETTAPSNAVVALAARREGLANFSLLVSHVLVPPALEALMAAPGNRVQGFLAAGHVCTIMGWREYESIALRHRIPIVVTGFEPVDLLAGIHQCLLQLEQGRAEVANAYGRAVKPEGNLHARRAIEQVFEVVDRRWRGLGLIPSSGLGLREPFADLDATRRFELHEPSAAAPSECIAGEILRGVKKPHDCPAFGARCTPEHPLGATMVSSEGACAAHYKYARP